MANTTSTPAPLRQRARDRPISIIPRVRRAFRRSCRCAGWPLDAEQDDVLELLATSKSGLRRLGAHLANVQHPAQALASSISQRAREDWSRQARGPRPGPFSNPFFATLGIVGALTIGQGWVLPVPDASESAATTEVGASANPLTVFTQQIVAAFDRADPASMLGNAQNAYGLGDAGASGASLPEKQMTLATLTAYVVQPGDTVNSIAADHGISPSTIIWVNQLANPNHIRPGQELQLMSVDGTTHRVREGDTAATIAEVYGTSVEAIITANGLGADAIVRPSDVLLVPNATRGQVDPIDPPIAVRPLGTSSQRAFIAGLIGPARDSQRVTGVPASVTIAQAILETYWGTSFLAREANNYFGIKAHARPGTAGVVWIDAWEVESGQNVTRSEPFRKYTTVTDSLIDHGRFFLENPRYARAMEARDDPREFARRINAAGYATDPAYAGKLIALFDRFDLQAYDLQ